MMKTTHMKYMGYAIAAAVLLLYGCVSERDTVSVRQVESKAFIVLRAGEGRKNIFSLKYPLAFEFRKNVRRKIYYFDSSYFAKNDELCPGTGECKIEANDNDEYLTDKYKEFEGNVLYTIEGNDTMQRTLSEYCRAMLEEKKDTIHIPLEIFKEKHGELIREYLDGDSIYLHFHDHKRFYDVLLKVDFLIKEK